MRKLFLTLILAALFSSNIFAADGISPDIYTVTLTSADTEYSQKISPNAKKFTVQARTEVDLRLSYETGYVAGSTNPYLTVKGGSAYWEDNLNNNIDSLTLYLASSTAGTVVEIIVWR